MLGALKAKLHVITGSIPCAAVEAAMEIKGFEYRRVELPFVLHRLPQRLRYGRPTVPGLTLPDGEKVIGSTAILHRLEALAPEPPLYPADPQARAAVEAAETWCDEVLQDAVRGIEMALFRRRPGALLSYAEAMTLPAPKWLIRAQAPIILRRYSKARGADDAGARAAVEAFPGYLDRMDDLIGEGTIGGPSPNAADLQLGAVIMLFGSLKDLAPMLAGRPCAALARRYPPMIGEVPAGTAPADWSSAVAPEPARRR